MSQKNREPTEAQTQAMLISYLSSMARPCNFIYFAPLNEILMTVLTMFKVPKQTTYRIINYFKKMGFLAGISDIIILKNGMAYCLELKTSTGKQKDSQKLFEKACQRVGVPYLIARSFEECKVALKVWGIV